LKHSLHYRQVTVAMQEDGGRIKAAGKMSYEAFLNYRAAGRDDASEDGTMRESRRRVVIAHRLSCKETTCSKRFWPD
jgi:hypothetical protein